VLRVARTVADLDGEAATGPDAMAEALSFRSDSTPSPGV
jgi:predicted ATPase with chaperone activity